MAEHLVKTSSGVVRGYERDGRIDYLGIPYADPPVGPLRFKRSVPITPWEGVYDAKEYGNAPVQYNNGKVMGDEDCLTVNVQRPLTGEKLPVFVWIYGGGYNTGYSHDEMYTGEAFVKDDILFFSFNYRTNILGFYDFTTYPGCDDFDSNCGLSDQILALNWIRDNVEAFGGDPERITIAGESAGGTIASLVGVTVGHKEFDVGDNLEYDSAVAAVLDFYGLTDMSLGRGDFGEDCPVPSWCMEAFMGYHYKEEKRASAISYVDDDTPPFMILHGSADPLVDIRNSEMLYDLLVKHGREAEFYILEGAVHGDDLFYQEPMMERIDAFLKRVMN